MIRAAPGALACPTCTTQYEDPRYQSFTSMGEVLYSDRGVPVAAPTRRVHLLADLKAELIALSGAEVCLYLLAELERQNGEFEIAAQRLRLLIHTSKDPALVNLSRQNLALCLEGHRLKNHFPHLSRKMLGSPLRQNISPFTS